MTGPAPRPLRLATYNIEWFNALFDDKGHLLEDNELSARFKTTRRDQLGAIAVVLSAMDADGVMIIEGPDQGSKRSTVAALENFARHFGLRTRRAISNSSTLICPVLVSHQAISVSNNSRILGICIFT